MSAASLTKHYNSLPKLLEKHIDKFEWRSIILRWTRELGFLLNLLHQYAPKFTSKDEQAKIDDFESVIPYYHSELIDPLNIKLLEHENQVAAAGTQEELKEEYFKEHEELIQEIDFLNKSIMETKEELFNFIEGE